MKLLISPTNPTEAQEAVEGGADIIDVKNPKEGALGANYPWVIKQIQAITPKNLEVSCTLGEIPNLPGSISLAALGAASLGVNYIKVGLLGIKIPQEATILLQNVAKASKEYNPTIKVVAAGYADAQQVNSIDPLLIPEIAHNAHVDVAMLDTAIKNGKNLFDHLTPKQLKKFVETAHRYGLTTALAGSLRKQDLPQVYALGADIAGVRSAACTGNDRLNGKLDKALIVDLVETIRQAEKQRA
ncbi:MAG: (5-formylfuran-3-yl)methyl phosphate synthase [Candidatus Bathyarchaeota archaeon]|nr:(5-formylfuran-3-yl)methyl phosphate synthase [Candidatus Bathyarchaeota archaeon]